MPVRLVIDVDDDLAEALDQLIADMELDLSRELAAEAGLRDWLIWAGYLGRGRLQVDDWPG